MYIFWESAKLSLILPTVLNNRTLLSADKLILISNETSTANPLQNNKKTQEVPMGSTLSDIYKEINLQLPYEPVSAKVNNKVEGLHYRVYHNKDIEFLDLRSPSGIRTYTRSLVHGAL